MSPWNLFKKKAIPPPTFKEYMHADLMMAIAKRYRESEGSFIVKSILRSAAKKIEKEYGPILERGRTSPQGGLES